MRQVDVVALAREEKAVDQGLALLNNVYSSGAHEPDEYAKHVFVLSYRLFHLGDVNGGLRVLGHVPVGYFRNTLLTHMREDENIAEIGRRIADTLVMVGEAHPKPVQLSGPVQSHIGVA